MGTTTKTTLRGLIMILLGIAMETFTGEIGQSLKSPISLETVAKSTTMNSTKFLNKAMSLSRKKD